MTPAIVGAYHNLIPICTIGLAYLLLNEPVTMFTILGAATVVAGTELVRRAPLVTAAGRSVSDPIQPCGLRPGTMKR